MINKKEILLHYPVGAGGKFIWTCLAQSDQVLFQYNTKLSTYEQHVEWLEDYNHQEFDENSYVKQIGDDQKFYPNIVHEWPEQDQPCLSLYNYNWILYRRNRKTRTINGKDLEPNKPKEVKPNFHLFNMQSLLYKDKFLQEIQNTCKWLGIDMLEEKKLDHVRRLFVDTCHRSYKMNFK